MADGATIEGVDYAFPPRPNTAQLAAAGIRFACRYGGPGSSDKQLTLAEAQALNAAGIAIVANAEGSANGLINGFAAGMSWARLAEEHFRACGMPAGRPIYFSVDFDTTSGDWDELDAAMDGAASVIGRERVGVYGEYSIIEHLAANQRARWYWQTYAWSGGRWSAHNHIEQYRNGVALAGADVDLNRAKTVDFGQWTIGDDMGWTDKLTLTIDGKPVTAEAQHWLMGANDAAWKTLFAVRASSAEDATRDAGVLAAVQALATAGGVDGAPIVEAIRAEAAATRALVEQKHAEEMAALRAERNAEVAALRAELEALTTQAS
jgi:hypothetical protein